MTELTCQRCGMTTDRLYDFDEINEDTQQKETTKICWDCDWEISNGRGDMSDDVGDIILTRQEQAYEYDPINNAPPQGVSYV